MTQTEPEAIAREVDGAARDARDWHTIAKRLRDLGYGKEHSLQGWILAAFDYHLTHQGPKRGRIESPFVPMIVMESGDSYPVPVDDAPAEATRAWNVVASLVTQPAPIARLNHLLVERKHRPVQEHAAAAAAAYEQLGQHWDGIPALDALWQGWNLTRRFRKTELESRIRDALVRLLTTELNKSDPRPGVVLGAARLLQDAQDERVDPLLERAWHALRHSAFNAEGVLLLQRKRARGNPNEVARLDELRIRAWLDEADRSEPMARLLHLETAARLADRFHFPELLAEIQRDLQSIDPSKLGLEHVTSEVEVPREAIEEFISSFVDRPSWQEALLLLISAPPTGDVNENRHSLARTNEEFPLQALFPRVRLGGDGLPRYKPETESQKEDAALAQQETLRLQVVAPLLSEVLDRIAGKFGTPAETAFLEFLQGFPLLSENIRTRLAECYRRYWNRDYEFVGYAGPALVESILRDLVVSSGAGIYRVQREKRPGQYPGLGVLLNAMRSGLDESWFRFLWTFLASPAGMNFRNEIYHGFVPRVGQSHATLLLIAATYVGLLQPEEAHPIPDD